MPCSNQPLDRGFPFKLGSLQLQTRSIKLCLVCTTCAIKGFRAGEQSRVQHQLTFIRSVCPNVRFWLRAGSIAANPPAHPRPAKAVLLGSQVRLSLALQIGLQKNKVALSISLTRLAVIRWWHRSIGPVIDENGRQEGPMWPVTADSLATGRHAP